MKTIEERFAAKVEKTETCWNWTGSVDETGYGRIYSNTLHYPAYAHRISYEMNVGPIPTGLVVDHMCHNRRCVSPGHLRLVTPKQNNENHNGPQRNSRTGVRGVSVHGSTGKFRATVRSAGRTHALGYFDTLSEAESVVIAKRNQLHTHNIRDRVA